MRIIWGGRGTRLERRAIPVVPLEGGLEVIAHRGASGAAPEQTRAAFGEAIGVAHSVELDMQISADGVPVCCHDFTVDRTSDLTGDVIALTIAQLEAGDFGTWFHARFAGAKIPRLRDALKDCAQWARLIYPEIKRYRTSADIELYMREIVDLGLEDRCVVTCFSPEDLARVRLYSAAVGLGFTVSTLTELDALLPVAAKDGNAMLFAVKSVLLANPDRVPVVRARDVDIVAWDVVTATESRQLAEIGVYRQVFATSISYGGHPL